MTSNFQHSYDVIMTKTTFGENSTVYIFLQYYFKFHDNPELLDLINKLRAEYFPEVPEKNYRTVYDFSSISNPETPSMYFRINKKFKSLINCQAMTYKEACEKMKKRRQVSFEYYIKSKEIHQGNNTDENAVNE